MFKKNKAPVVYLGAIKEVANWSLRFSGFKAKNTPRQMHLMVKNIK